MFKKTDKTNKPSLNWGNGSYLEIIIGDLELGQKKKNVLINSLLEF